MSFRKFKILTVKVFSVLGLLDSCGPFYYSSLLRGTMKHVSFDPNQPNKAARRAEDKITTASRLKKLVGMTPPEAR